MRSAECACPHVSRAVRWLALRDSSLRLFGDSVVSATHGMVSVCGRHFAIGENCGVWIMMVGWQRRPRRPVEGGDIPLWGPMSTAYVGWIGYLGGRGASDKIITLLQVGGVDCGVGVCSLHVLGVRLCSSEDLRYRSMSNFFDTAHVRHGVDQS